MDTRHVCAPSAVHLTWTGQSPAQPAKQHHQLLEQIALEDSRKDSQASLARQRRGGKETSEYGLRASQKAYFNCVLTNLENNLYIQTNKMIVFHDIAGTEQGWKVTGITGWESRSES